MAGTTRFRRRMLAATLGAALVTSLAACGGSSANQDQGDGKLAGDVTFWSSYTQGPRAEWLQKMADKFEAENPDVHITIENFSWGEFYTKWTAGVASGQLPDISSALPYHVTEMLDAGVIAPLDDVIDEIGRDRFPESALKEGAKDGHNYSIPLYSHAQAMWIRKDVLEENGLEVPETWEELRDAAKKVSTPDLYGLSVPLGTNDVQGVRYLNYYVKSAGGSLITEDGKANLTSPEALEGIKYWVDLYNEVSPKGSINFNILDQATLYYQGKTAFDFNTGFQIGGVQATTPSLDDKIEAAPLPRLHKGDPIYGAETGYQPMVVWETSDVQEEAKAFLLSLYNDEDYIEFLKGVPIGMMPVLKDIAENPEFRDDPEIQKHIESFDVINQAIPLSSAIGMENGPRIEAGILVNQGVVESMFQDIILNGTDINTAAKNAEDQLNKMFEQARR